MPHASITTIVKEEKKRLKHAFLINTSLSRNFAEQKVAVQRLIDESQPNSDYFVLLVFSTLITTLGLLVGSTAIVIGGMLITPLLSSVLALGLGFVTFNGKSIARSGWSVLRSVLFVLLLSYLTAQVVGVENIYNIEILQRTFPSRIYVHVALLSGMAATYAWAKPRLSATLPGVAVAVALLPPLCVVGIGLADTNITVITGAFDMFLVNFVGIIISAIFIYTVLGFRRMKKVEEKEIKVVEENKTPLVSKPATTTIKKG